MKYSIIKNIFRNSIKVKHSSIINLIGLSLGFTVLFAIIFFIRDELNCNQFHDKIDNLYCVFTKDAYSTNGIGGNESVPALAEALRTEYPEVNDAALVYNGTERMLLSYENIKFYEQVQLSDPNLFNIFSFPIIKGSMPKNPDETRVIALSRKMASKYFGSKEPIGKTISLNNSELFTVAAVFEDIPANSSIRFDIWAPIKLLEGIEGKDHLKTWYNLSFQAYVCLNNNVSLSKLNKKLYSRIQQSNPDSEERAQLYPFKDLYLKAWNHKKGITMMVFIAVIILTLVSINFINLQTSEAFNRIKTFGIKKINGANQRAITSQLFFEALFCCLISLAVAVSIVKLSSEYLFSLMGKSASTTSLISVFSMLFLLGVAFIIAFISGVIPSLAIRSVSPANSLKNKVQEQVSVKNMRVVFTSLQFCLAIVLVICLLLTNKQLSFMRNKNLGFNKDQIVYVHLEGDLIEKRELLRDELEKCPSILSATLASRSPVGIYWNGDGWDWEAKPEDFNPQITFIETDNHFQKTFGIKMAEGNYFNTEAPGVIINKTFAQMIAPKQSALNKILKHDENGIQTSVLGVIEDIHFKPLYREVGALMIIPQMGFDPMKYVFMKIAPSDMQNTLLHIKKTVTMLNPDFPSQYFFLDDDFARLYGGEKQLRNQILFFSIMAIFISCMGLWGILMFMVKQRTKEIGIRKVNGARISDVLAMLNKDFVKWVAIAFVIAIPIAWYVMHKWLENFAYKTTLSWWIFALAGLLALGIALLTVSWQSWRAATRNPVEALRYE
ncbi:MAG: ABC transporter permease [Salinivirgaceae bacterium]|nr:ABC transporter permease [Salinivirgaceae bacterium]